VGKDGRRLLSHGALLGRCAHRSAMTECMVHDASPCESTRQGTSVASFPRNGTERTVAFLDLPRSHQATAALIFVNRIFGCRNCIQVQQLGPPAARFAQSNRAPRSDSVSARNGERSRFPDSWFGHDVVSAGFRRLVSVFHPNLPSRFEPLRTLTSCPRNAGMAIRKWLLLLPLLGGCTHQERVDCTAIQWPTLSKCFDEHRSHGDGAMLLACMPFSQPIKTEGTWVLGFEVSDFIEGKRPPPADMMWTDPAGSELILDDKVHEKIPPVGPQSYAFQVAVVGRRALCPIGIREYPIVVSNLKILRRIGVR